jgi:hypothetical protein
MPDGKSRYAPETSVARQNSLMLSHLHCRSQNSYPNFHCLLNLESLGSVQHLLPRRCFPACYAVTDFEKMPGLSFSALMANGLFIRPIKGTVGVLMQLLVHGEFIRMLLQPPM